jgi:glycolate oxidase
MLSDGAKTTLRKIFPGSGASDQMEDRLVYGFDATGRETVPEMVVFPTTTQQVADLMRCANEYRFPVVPRGAGSGFVGGAVPIHAGVVANLTRMNRILAIDADNLTVEVEPGVVTAHLQAAVEKAGFFYPPDPASLKVSTIGGNVATGAGGPRAVKYGVTRDYVLGLEVVLPTGEIIRTGARTMKSVVGYDLTRLMVGSEGTLGIVTNILLRLLPLPQTARTALAMFPTVDAAASTVAAVIRNKVIPRTLEFMDKSAVRAVEAYLHYGLPVDAGAILLLETDGTAVAAEAEMDTIIRICKENGAIDVQVAADEAQRERLWTVRRSISPSILRIRPTKINEDVTVPRSRIPDLMRDLAALSERIDLPIINFGHAGDGNIHVNVMTDKNDAVEYERGKKAIDEVFDICLRLEGTLSGEHGIGVSKSPWIELEIGAVGVRLTRQLKAVFDPNNILNPGKIVPEETAVVG